MSEYVPISGLDELAEFPSADDWAVIVDISEPFDIDKTKKIKISNLVNLAAQAAVQALVSGQAAGDIFYASSGTALARLAKGAAKQALVMNAGATAPEWASAKGLHDIQIAHSTGEKSYASSWEDHPGLSVTLTLTAPSTVVMFAVVTGYVNTTSAGYAIRLRGVIDGTADSADAQYNGSANPVRNEALPYIWYRTGIAAGSRIVKLQCQGGSPASYITNGRIIALAFTE